MGQNRLQAERSRLRPAHYATLAAILLLGLGLRLYGIGAHPLWLDEAATHSFATMPLADLFGDAGRAETNPPLFYLIEHAWVSVFGTSEISLRLPAAIFGCASLVVTFLAGRWLVNPRVGLLAAAFAATMVYPVKYAQEARAYTLMTLGAMTAVAGLAHLLRDPPRAGAFLIRARGDRLGWALYITGMTLALYAHNTAVLVASSLTLAAVFAFCLQPRRFTPGFAANWLFANLLVLLLWLPWMLVVFGQLHAMGDFWIETPALVELVRYPIRIYVSTFGPLDRASQVGVLVAGIAFAAACFRAKRYDLLFLVAVLTGGVFVQAFLISQSKPIYTERIFVWTVPVFAIALAVGVLSLPHRAPAIVLALWLVAINAYNLAVFYRSPAVQRWDQVADVLQQHDRPGTLKIAYPCEYLSPLHYYAADRDRWIAVPMHPGDDKPYLHLTGIADRFVTFDDLPPVVEDCPRFLMVLRDGNPDDDSLFNTFRAALGDAFTFNTLYEYDIYDDLRVVEAVRQREAAAP